MLFPAEVTTTHKKSVSFKPSLEEVGTSMSVCEEGDNEAVQSLQAELIEVKERYEATQAEVHPMSTVVL